MTDYTDYLNSKHWLAFRDYYRKIRRWRCATPGCREKEDLHLHHLTYERIGKERLDDVVPLCRYHHALAHLENMIFGKDLAEAHLELEVEKEVSVRDALAAQILFELGAYDELEEEVFLDLDLTKKYRRAVSKAADFGAKEYDRGSHPQAVLDGCLQAIREENLAELDGYIALAEIEGGYI